MRRCRTIRTPTRTTLLEKEPARPTFAGRRFGSETAAWLIDSAETRRRTMVSVGPNTFDGGADPLVCAVRSNPAISAYTRSENLGRLQDIARCVGAGLDAPTNAGRGRSNYPD